MTNDRLIQLCIGVIATLPLVACNTPAVSLPNPTPTPKVASASGSNRSVTDYFIEAPEQYFKISDRDSVSGEVRQALLQKSGAIVDPANGYIYTNSVAPDLCSYQMAIFRRSRGAHLVALNVTCTMGDTLTILDPDQDWQDVTATILPIKLTPSPDETIRLPRQGRTIEVRGENNQLTAQVKFDRDRFAIVK